MTNDHFEAAGNTLRITVPVGLEGSTGIIAMYVACKVEGALGASAGIDQNGVGVVRARFDHPINVHWQDKEYRAISDAVRSVVRREADVKGIFVDNVNAACPMCEGFMHFEASERTFSCYCIGCDNPIYDLHKNRVGTVPPVTPEEEAHERRLQEDDDELAFQDGWNAAKEGRSL